jgi:signal transduction histidine kinase
LVQDRLALTYLMAILLVLESVMLLFVVAWALRRRRPSHRAKPLFLIYALLSLLWAVADTAILLGNADVTAASAVQRGLRYGLFLLALLFLSLTRVALGRSYGSWSSWLIGLGWLAVVLVLDTGTLAPGAALGSLVPGMLAVGTAVAVLVAGALIVQAYRQVRPPLERGRLIAWILPLPALLVGGTLLYAGYAEAGIAVHLMAVPLVARALLAPRIDSGRQAVERTLAYLVAAGLAFGLYAGAFVGVRAAFGTAPSSSVVIAGGVIALGIALLFGPLVSLIQQGVRRLLFGGKVDPAQVVKEVERQIRDASSVEGLSSALLEVVRQLWSPEAAFFAVHPLAESEGTFWLEPVGASAEGESAGHALGIDSPVAHYLETETHPLTRNEVEQAPQFVGMQANERDWFLEREAYVPLHARGEWIGLLALGDRGSGGPYLEEDLWLLRRLAEGAAPVLWYVLQIRASEGAQAQLKRAYLALEGRLEHLQATYDSLEAEHRRLADENAAKARFLATIDEGLRTPFANLDFALQLMEHHGLEGWTRDQRDQLEQLRAEVHKAKQMAENLIAFAGLLRGQERIAKDELDLEPVIRSMVAPLRAQAEAKQVHLAVEIGSPLPLVYGDRRWLGDAVFQLAHNALKFTGPDGSIWVRCWGDKGTVHVEVQDTGIGISAERVDDLWEGQDAQREHVEPEEGLGLGLALAHHVIRAHGGKVYVESELKVGSTFGFEIPTEAARETSPLAHEMQPGGS